MKNVFIFVAGAATGAVTAWKLLEKYYKDLADEEIASVVDRFKDREKELKDYRPEEEHVENIKGDVKEDNARIINTENYGAVDVKIAEDNLINIDQKEFEHIAMEIINPAEYGELEDYDTKAWMLWNDGVLTDENDEIVENPSEFIGSGLSHFGDYEEDSVYVRNNANQTDYEILKSENDFGEI